MFMTTAEVARALRLNVKTVRKGIDDGTIPAVRVGRALRVPSAWLEQHQEPLEPLGSSDDGVRGT